MIKRILLFTTFILLFQPAFCVQKIFMFHINGINTTQAKAWDNVAELEKNLQIKSNVIANDGHIGLIYNKEDKDSFCSLCKQLNDVLNQKHYENITLDDFVIAYMRDRNLSYEAGSKEYLELKNSIKEKYFNDPKFVGSNFPDIRKDFFDQTTLQAKFKNITTFIKSNLQDGMSDYMDTVHPYVVLIPHSQGNLYANELYYSFFENKDFPLAHVKIIGIATPADKSYGQYITSSNDRVINVLRWFLQPEYTVLPANIDIPLDSMITDTGHSLIDDYLKNENSLNLIRNAIYSVLGGSVGSIGGAMVDSSSRYNVFYQFTSNNTNLVNRPQLIAPDGKNVICTNAEECEEKKDPYICFYNMISGYDKKSIIPQTCNVLLKTTPGIYTALGLNYEFTQDGERSSLSVLTLNDTKNFYCYKYPHCISQQDNICLQYSVEAEQSDPGCHILSSPVASNIFEFENTLPEMFENGYYRAFWFQVN